MVEDASGDRLDASISVGDDADDPEGLCAGTAEEELERERCKDAGFDHSVAVAGSAHVYVGLVLSFEFSSDRKECTRRTHAGLDRTTKH